jgi:hypothetical protein
MEALDYNSFYSSISSDSIDFIICSYIYGLFIFNENSRNFLNNSFFIPNGKFSRLLSIYDFKFC